jgi:hypothetical protein
MFSLIGIAVLFSIFGTETILENLKPDRFKPENMDVNSILIFSAFPLITCLLSPFSGGLIKMAYCAERDEEFHVSTMFEYYKALISQNYLLQHFSYSDEYRNRWHTKFQIPILDVVVSVTIGLFTIMMIPLIILEI